MRKLKQLAALLVLGLVLAPIAAVATGITIIPAGARIEFVDCAAAGSAAQTVAAGTYLFRVTDENVFICYAATCASPNGEKFPSGTVITLTVQASTSMSCRSAASTGDAIFTPAG